MERAASLDDFRQKPAGRYLAGASWVHFCASPELYGLALFGHPTGDDTRALVESLKTELLPAVRPHKSLVDTRRLGAADLDAFQLLSTYVREHGAPLAAKVTRLALVRPDGIEGAVVSGFFTVTQSPYPVEVFGALDDAAAWLGAPADAGFVATLTTVVDELAGTDPVLSKVRAWLDGHAAQATLEHAARGLALSVRTLQRRLTERETSFHDELARARVRLAKKRLLLSEAPVSTIALDLGLSTPQQLSALFKKETGETPTAWRARQRTGGSGSPGAVVGRESEDE